MTTATNRSVPTDASVGTFEEIYPILRAEANESERLRRPTPNAQAAIRNSGLVGMMMPRALGGWEAGPLEVIKVIETVTHADPATGWLVRALMTETAIAATYLPEESAAELFGNPEPTIAAGFSSGQLGRARRLPDGSLRIDGRWQFAPGASMATHVNLPVRIEGTNEDRVCVVPRWMVAITDNWEMLGLHGSAAFDIEATDVAVPEQMSYVFAPEHARYNGVVAQLTPVLLAAMNHGAWSQGIARRMLDELRIIVQRTPGGDGPAAAEDFFAEFAHRHATVNAGMALLTDTWRSIAAVLERGERLGDEDETMIRLAAICASRTAVEMSQVLHRFAGAHVMRNGSLQRLFRDAHTGAQHRDSAHDVMRSLGKTLVGITQNDNSQQERQ